MASQVNINRILNPRAMDIDGSSHVVGWEGVTSGTPWIDFYSVLRSTTGGPSAAIPSYGYYDIDDSPPNVEYASVGQVVGVPVPNTTYTFLSYGSSSVAADLRATINWYDTIEAALDYRTILRSDTSPAISLLADTWGSARVMGETPQGAGAFRLTVSMRTAPGGLHLQRVKFSGMLVAESVGANAPYSGEYFDGSTTASGITSYEWTGAPHQSSSAQTIQLTTALTPPSIGMLTVIGKA